MEFLDTKGKVPKKTDWALAGDDMLSLGLLCLYIVILRTERARAVCLGCR